MEEENLGLIFRRISNAIKKDADNYMKDIDLTMSQCMVLEFLTEAHEDSVTQRDIEQHFNLQHPTVSGILKRLQRNGFVKSVLSKMDRRSKNIYVLDKAKMVHDRIASHNEEMEKKFVNGFQNDEIKLLRSLLDRVLTNVMNE